MSTNAGIGMKMADGSVRAVRLNFDGYPGYAGALLGSRYRTAEQVAALLALGELSEIGETLEICVAYHRDMNEDYRPPFTFKTADDYRRHGQEDFAAGYLYLFEDGKWSVYGLDDTSGWIDLETVVGKTEDAR